MLLVCVSTVMLIRPSYMSAGRASKPRAKSRPAGLQDMFGDTSESEASTFHGFEEDELEGLLSDDSAGSP